MKSSNLAAYLAAALNVGISTHTVRASARPGGDIHFLIHPTDRDGETLDFSVRGNALQLLTAPRAHLCGVTCRPGDTNCNGYCIGKAERPASSGTSDEAELEQQIQTTKPKAPRLSPADIDAAIVGETFTVLPSGRVTVCELTLRNGFTVRGESAVVSIENFNAEIGERVARQNARGKIWELEGYLLREKLHAEG